MKYATEMSLTVLAKHMKGVQDCVKDSNARFIESVERPDGRYRVSIGFDKIDDYKKFNELFDRRTTNIRETKRTRFQQWKARISFYFKELYWDMHN